MDSSLMLASDPVTGGITYKGHGKWELEERPGIGADFSPDILEKMEQITIS